MHPQKYEFLRRFELVWLRHEQSLEHVAEVPDVEFVVEVCCCLPEIRSNLFTHSQFRVIDGVMFWTSIAMDLGATTTSFEAKAVRVANQVSIMFRGVCSLDAIDAPPHTRGAHLAVKSERSFDHVA